MIEQHHENERLRMLVRRLLEAAMGEDAMICHDGGFRYSGDFMSMEPDIVQSVTILSPDEHRELFERGFVEPLDDKGTTAVRVTDAGRAFAFEDGTLT